MHRWCVRPEPVLANDHPSRAFRRKNNVIAPPETLALDNLNHAYLVPAHVYVIIREERAHLSNNALEESEKVLCGRIRQLRRRRAISIDSRGATLQPDGVPRQVELWQHPNTARGGVGDDLAHHARGVCERVISMEFEYPSASGVSASQSHDDMTMKCDAVPQVR
jgi:hypothetical protein